MLAVSAVSQEQAKGAYCLLSRASAGGDVCCLDPRILSRLETGRGPRTQPHFSAQSHWPWPELFYPLGVCVPASVLMYSPSSLTYSTAPCKSRAAGKVMSPTQHRLGAFLCCCRLLACSSMICVAVTCKDLLCSVVQSNHHLNIQGTVADSVRSANRNARKNQLVPSAAALCWCNPSSPRQLHNWERAAPCSTRPPLHAYAATQCAACCAPACMGTD